MNGRRLTTGENISSDRAVLRALRQMFFHVPVANALILVLALSGFSGCQVGPDYTPPHTPLVSHWKHPQKASSVTDADLGVLWWSEFQDPTLENLIRRAVEANPGVHEASFRVMEARARYGVVSGERFPEVNATGAYDYKKISDNSSPYAIVSRDSYSLLSTGFDAAWEMDLWGKYRQATEAAGAEIGIAENDYDFVMLTLLGDVAAAYIELRMYQQRISVAQGNMKIQEHTLRLAQERQRTGLANPLDSAQATRSLYTTKSTLPELDIGYQRAENRLCILLGVPPQDLREQLGGPRQIPTVRQNPALGLPANLLRRRPDIRGAELKVVAESARIGVAVADLYPQLSLTGTITVDSTDLTNWFTPESIAHKIGPSLTWNILNFGRIRSRIQAQEARLEQATWRYQATVLSATEEVENALIASEREQDRLGSLGRAVGAGKESVRLASLYYEQGLTNFQSVLDSQRALLLLQDQQVVSRAGVTLNRVALYKALGGAWEVDPFDERIEEIPE